MDSFLTKRNVHQDKYGSWLNRAGFNQLKLCRTVKNCITLTFSFASGTIFFSFSTPRAATFFSLSPLGTWVTFSLSIVFVNFVEPLTPGA